MENIYPIFSKKKSNISNLLIKSDYDNNNNTIFEFDINYINEYIFYLEVKIIHGSGVTMTFIDKYYPDLSFDIEISGNYYNNDIISKFKLIKDEEEYRYKIPKIIHQSYKKNVKKNMYNAIATWKMMNINYTYKYWDDDDCYNLILSHFDNKVKNAYNSLYAGAYKSDIFRLCLLYIYGGIWADISSVCKYPLDKLLEENINLIIVKDTPSQVTNGNIYQAFIIVEPNNEIIKYILDFTVDRVINFERYDRLYPYIKGETIAVSGPTVFATALNRFLGRIDNSLIKDDYINIESYRIKLLDHFAGRIMMKDFKICSTKYMKWGQDRTNRHYSDLFRIGYVNKKQIKDIKVNGKDGVTLFQIWIQNDYVSYDMYNAIQSWIQKNPNLNYTLLTNEKILKLIKDDIEFPLLYDAYNKIKPFAYKSDLIRYFIMYKYGGVYSDIDTICINSIESFYNNYDFVISTDIDNSSLCNAFICSKKGNTFFKVLLHAVINNIINNISGKSDLYITGSGILSETFLAYFGVEKPIQSGDFNSRFFKYKILKYNFNLPLPSGGWMNSSRNYSVIRGNILKAECRGLNGEWVNNEIVFSLGDVLDNRDGKLVNNTEFEYKETPGSGLMFSDDRVYINSKYFNYNKERLIMDGNDFAKMYNDKDIFTQV
jgi:mannosyltransferase OCH1-like enzyme